MYLLPFQNRSQTQMGWTEEVGQQTAHQILFPSGHRIIPALKGPSHQGNFDSNINKILSKTLKQLEVTAKSNWGGRLGRLQNKDTKANSQLVSLEM